MTRFRHGSLILGLEGVGELSEQGGDARGVHGITALACKSDVAARRRAPPHGTLFLAAVRSTMAPPPCPIPAQAPPMRPRPARSKADEPTQGAPHPPNPRPHKRDALLEALQFLSVDPCLDRDLEEPLKLEGERKAGPLQTGEPAAHESCGCGQYLFELHLRQAHAIEGRAQKLGAGAIYSRAVHHDAILPIRR